MAHGGFSVFPAGHGEAAVKLQRDWVLEPQLLPFADNVKAHALISLIQKGLQYHEIERSLKDVRFNRFLSATPYENFLACT